MPMRTRACASTHTPHAQTEMKPAEAGVTSSLLILIVAKEGFTHFFSRDHMPPSVVSLNHAAEKASSKAWGFLAYSSTMAAYFSSCRRATSLVSRMMPASSPLAPATLHCQWPPGPRCFSQVLLRRNLKNSLSQLVGLVDHGPSKPLVKVSLPLPLPHMPGQGFVGSSSGGGPAPRGHAPCVLPKAWPPPMSATVSESFMPMRPKASRMSPALPAGLGSGAQLPSGFSTTGPSGLR
mmetsp:Transcript_97870/g.310408  ORF Transcript_97870/g.310408 Transcript_97870/m.310408 type:complete len:236 (+) Transcript_97870:165-872(+)